MFRTEPMQRMTLVAEKSILVRLVHVLQSLGCVQLAPDGVSESRGVSRAAAHTFFPVEGYLVSLRSMKDYLRMLAPRKWEPVPESELLVTLPDQMEIFTAEVQKLRAEIEALTAEDRELDRQIRSLTPFANARIDLSLLSGYRHLTVQAARLEGELPECGVPVIEIKAIPLPRNSSRLLFFLNRDGQTAAERRLPPLRIFAVPTEGAALLQQALEKAGALDVKLPELQGRGMVQDIIHRCLDRRDAVQHRLQELEARRAMLAEQWCVFVHAAEETLVSLLSKNSGTTNFVASKYAVAGQVWLPCADMFRVTETLKKHFPKGLVVEPVETAAHGAHHAQAGVDGAVAEAGHVEEPLPPTLMKTSFWTRPFVLLTEMFDVPSSRELDPTTLMAICFPLFFGFMVGDVGYGAVMALGGYALLRRFGHAAFGEMMADLGRILLAGGVVSVLFGFFLFADAFGIPFHPEENAVFWWEKWIPFLPHPVLLKTEGSSVNTMLLLSVVVGWLHMGLGCVFGIINEFHHSRRHALGKFGQLLLISGFSVLILGLDSFRTSAVGHLLWQTLLLPVDAVGAASCVEALLLAGIVSIGVGEGPMGLLEFFGLFGNVISFTRLALVGVSKAAVAIAVNTVLLPQMMDGGSVLKFIGVFIALTVAHLMLVLLGGLSASIQSVRLHYCETFSKFFKGSGTRFAPFRFSRMFTRS